ncbi:MAG: Mur ligase family protein [Nocardioidaceae bacterium]
MGITGSQGKTSTKDLLSQVLATAGATVATAGNLNNEIGVPLTVLPRRRGHPLPRRARWGRAASATSPTCAAIAQPSVGVVLNVGHRAHRRVRLRRT